MKTRFKMRAKVWLYPGMAWWHFVSVPKKHSQTIKRSFGVLARGWGSLRVRVTVGDTSWKTSIFPDKKSGTYLLPLKLSVRKSEDISNRDIITFQVEILT